MTGPLSDDPYEGLPLTRRRITRELLGAAAIVCGLIVLCALLGSVDGRLPIGLGALVLLAGGIFLARGDGEVT